MKGPLFYAKILLFGEYGIIKDSKGLSIPYNFYRGALKLNATAEFEDSHQKLVAFCAYLKKLPKATVHFDWKALERDLSQKMYFDSSIPQGYGVGSSGALVAAIYDQYAQDKITVLENLTKEKTANLKANVCSHGIFLSWKFLRTRPIKQLFEFTNINPLKR